MNLINRLSILAAASRDTVLHRVGRNLQPDTEVDKFAIVSKGIAACNFNFTEEFLTTEGNTEVFTYAPGDVCDFGLTTVSYITEPMSAQVYKGEGSNTFEIQDSHHLALMKTDEEGKFYCIEDAFTKSNSTQYPDGTASFYITAGEIAVTSQSIGTWTSVSVNGARNLKTPGFYYIEDGSVSGDVIFKDDAMMETEANYTSLEGTLIDLCAKTNPPDSSSIGKSSLFAVGAVLSASAFFLL